MNRSFSLMGVKYAAREEPTKPTRRGRGASATGEEPLAKKKKLALAMAESSSKVAGGKPPWAPPSKVSTSKLEGSKKKGIHLDRYLRM